jgi:hypothetical protein
MGYFMRTPHGECPEYHTSADNLQFIQATAHAESWRLMRLALAILDEDRVFLNLSPKGEPAARVAQAFLRCRTARTILDPQFFGRPLQFAQHCRTCPYTVLEPRRKRPAS